MDVRAGDAMTTDSAAHAAPWMEKIRNARTHHETLEALEKMMNEKIPLELCAADAMKPIADVLTDKTIITVVSSPVTSLRDWFAGQALIGVLAGGASPAAAMQCASDAYRLADAMIAMQDMVKP